MLGKTYDMLFSWTMGKCIGKMLRGMGNMLVDFVILFQKIIDLVYQLKKHNVWLNFP